MSRLPRISGRDCVKTLGKAGFYLKRQQGSHMILRRDDPFGQVVSFLNTKNLTVERFERLSARLARVLMSSQNFREKYCSLITRY